ncbi:hypothetical protein ACDI35_12625 [Xanthomonas axonopodis pv. cajani]|uniref:hypothetical protein n=1 Tax=Xanthomonas axonopodis TaxID=53413 RepID=UPI003556D1F8
MSGVIGEVCAQALPLAAAMAVASRQVARRRMESPAATVGRMNNCGSVGTDNWLAGVSKVPGRPRCGEHALRIGGKAARLCCREMTTPCVAYLARQSSIGARKPAPSQANVIDRPANRTLPRARQMLYNV